MQRKQPGRLVGVVDLALEPFRDDLVQGLPGAEGQAPVGRLADHRPAEAAIAVAVLLEELGEAFPGAIVRRRRVGLQHVVEEPWDGSSGPGSTPGARARGR